MDNIPLKERTPEAKAAYREGFNAAILVAADLAVRKANLLPEELAREIMNRRLQPIAK